MVRVWESHSGPYRIIPEKYDRMKIKIKIRRYARSPVGSTHNNHTISNLSQTWVASTISCMVLRDFPSLLKTSKEDTTGSYRISSLFLSDMKFNMLCNMLFVHGWGLARWLGRRSFSRREGIVSGERGSPKDVGYPPRREGIP